MLRVETQLSDELEDLIYRTIGCCITVHRVLGPGLLEKIYSRALTLELMAQSIPFERETSFPVSYRGQLLCYQQLDFIVGAQLVLEIKSVEHIIELHTAQLLSYLTVSKMPVGLVINFNVPVLKDGIKRFVL
jgi:GxxExxY protein